MLFKLYLLLSIILLLLLLLMMKMLMCVSSIIFRIENNLYICLIYFLMYNLCLNTQMTIVILSIMLMMTYDDNVFVWSWHSRNCIIFIHNIFFCNISSIFFWLYLWNKLSNDNYYTIVLNNIYCCYYHHHLCHLLFNFHYYHQ